MAAEISIHEVMYSYSPFWIQIHGVPLEGFSEENARRIAGKVGEVEKVENPIWNNQIVRGFMRAKVIVDLTKPLATGFWIPRKEFPNAWAMIYYEKLQDYCYKCGRLGHARKECQEEMVMAIQNPNKPRYGPNLGVLPAKPLATIIAEMNYSEEQRGENHAPVRGREVGRSYVGVQGDSRTRMTEEGGSDTKIGCSSKKEAYPIRSNKDNLAAERQYWNAGNYQKECTNELPEEGMDSNFESAQTHRIGPSRGPGPSLTKIDLRERKERPGLEKEEIGLKRKLG